MATREVVVTSGAGLIQTIQTGNHLLLADEAVELGGQDAGPDPYELLLASLGACTSITVRTYANRKGWPLKQVKVRLEHWKVQAAGGNGKGGAVDEIKKVLLLEGVLSNVQRDRLRDVAEKCPIHRTLAKSVRIRTLLETES